jgi:ribose transport system permease protein
MPKHSSIASDIYTAQDQRRTVWQRVVALQSQVPLLQLIVLGAALIYGAVMMDGFFNPFSLRTMLVLASLLGLAALGQTLAILVGGIDVSIPAFIVLGSTLVTQFTGAGGVSLPVAILIIVVIAGSFGGLSGWIAHRYQIHPIIVTLAMGSLVSGILLGWTNATITGVAPAVLGNLTRPFASTFGLPVPPVVIIWLGVGVVTAVVLKRTVFGRQLYATALNPRAADLSLVRTRAIWTIVFAISAIGSAMTGLLVVGFAGTANATLGDPYLFQGLAAVILGGAAPLIGAVDYWRTMLGAMIFTVLSTLLVAGGFTEAEKQITFGILILIAVGVYGREPRVNDRV